MKQRRVKITGIGPVTPAGVGRSAFASGIRESVSRVTVLKSLMKHGAVAFVGAEISDDALCQRIDALHAGKLARHTQFAVVAADLAVRDAGLTLEGLRDRHAMIVTGSSLMDFGVMNRILERTLRKGPGFGLPGAVFSASASAIAGGISELIGGSTRTLALQSACCSGLDAIGHAAQSIATGEADVAICGGTEAPLYLHPMVELKMAGLAPDSVEMPAEMSRPFDLWRTTGVIGEGACMLVLEPAESPRPGYAWIDGYAYATDPEGQLLAGLRETIQLALANARRRALEVGCVSAWGPGHKLIDKAEAAVLREIFGPRLSALPVVSLKGAIGNPLGAAGAIQTGAAAIALRDGWIPPTVNWDYPDPDCPLNLSSQFRPLPHELTLINSHGLSGTNACLILSK